jgi:hypothetical protein
MLRDPIGHHPQDTSADLTGGMPSGRAPAYIDPEACR